MFGEGDAMLSEADSYGTVWNEFLCVHVFYAPLTFLQGFTVLSQRGGIKGLREALPLDMPPYKEAPNFASRK